MRPTLLQLVLLPFLLLITPAAAQMEVNSAGTVLTIKGSINQFECDDLWFRLQRFPNLKTVALSSAGGDGKRARCMGQLARQYRLSTIVLDHCMGSCVAIWLGGVERTLSDQKSALILTASIPNDQDARYDPGDIATLRDWLPLMVPKLDAKLLDQWINLPQKHSIQLFQDRAMICDEKLCKPAPSLSAKTLGFTTR